jgi:hypothetical protein
MTVDQRQIALRSVPSAEFIGVDADRLVSIAGFVSICGHYNIKFAVGTVYNSVKKDPTRWPNSRKVGKGRYFEVDAVFNWLELRIGISAEA